MELIVTTAGNKTSKLQVSDQAFGQNYNEDLVHQVVTALRAAERSGTKAQKTRAEVSGGGIKPWRQKGSGRARAGTIRSPIWRTGGVTFAAKPRNYAQKINKKMYKAALRSILSELIRQERMVVVDNITVSAPKTKELLDKLKNLNVANVLVVTDNIDNNLQLAARNLYDVAVCQTDNIDPVSLIAYDKVLMTVPAIKKVEERLG